MCQSGSIATSAAFNERGFKMTRCSGIGITFSLFVWTLCVLFLVGCDGDEADPAESHSPGSVRSDTPSAEQRGSADAQTLNSTSVATPQSGQEDAEPASFNYRDAASGAGYSQKNFGVALMALPYLTETARSEHEAALAQQTRAAVALRAETTRTAEAITADYLAMFDEFVVVEEPEIQASFNYEDFKDDNKLIEHREVVCRDGRLPRDVR